MVPGLNTPDRERMLSTGKVARLLSVTPDTVLKWIKSGRLRARRTAGGHYRIAQRDLDGLIGDGVESPTADDGGFLYCWEYYSVGGEPGDSCLDCLVYRARARRCYEMSSLAREVGYAGAYCTKTCQECSYYREVVCRSRRVLIVTECADLRRRLELDSHGSEVEVAFARSEYECSASCHGFKPEYVVIDGSLPESVRESLCSHLTTDPRIPGVQILLAIDVDDSTPSAKASDGVDRAIPRTFRLAELKDHIVGLEVRHAVPA